MEIYLDDYNPKSIRSGITGISVIMALFQFPYVFLESSFHSLVFCWLSLLLLIFFQIFIYTRFGMDFLKKRVFSQAVLLSYIMIVLTMFILNLIILDSKIFFDPSFYMFIFLIISLVCGVLTGLFFSDKRNLFSKHNIKIRNSEIELRKLEFFSVLTLKRMPFLRAPLRKLRNVITILAALIGTGGAGIGLGIAEVLKRSDVLAPDMSVHAVLFFSLGIPVLFTFGVLIYSTMTYLSEWRKLVASIDKEYGEHKIIFNSKKKSYKKIKEIMAESGSNPNG
ncbi:hypothetical protein GTG28_05650 [Vibrio sp. OCN044]|uniref:Uncharacterized protein n=1 Tax=Vibrio tetraodonis subsp. pristinus TaxID=2695891 RepID=A0A6L8LRI5_9VIBR|nr:hypothetical protein [Vibrio tetraodonis]MYM58701.1 hypothetical protein [Vibrio tetraodonis subsp. pristinus]